MKEYFFLKGKEQNGPFSIEQLSQKDLTNETLIWTEGMEKWQKLKDIEELVVLLKPKSVPPPLPIEEVEQDIRTEISGHLKVTNRNASNPTLDAIKPSRRALTWLIVWCSFHLFALLMSYSQIEIFNNGGKPESNEFWPFVKFQSCKDVVGWDYINRGGPIIGKDCHFEGVFLNYDLTEFAFYVGGAMVVFLLVQISKKKVDSKIIS